VNSQNIEGQRYCNFSTQAKKGASFYFGRQNFKKKVINGITLEIEISQVVKNTKSGSSILITVHYI